MFSNHKIKLNNILYLLYGNFLFNTINRNKVDNKEIKRKNELTILSIEIIANNTEGSPI